MKRKLTVLFVVLGLSLVLFLTLLPGLAKSYLNKNGKELVGRSIQIEKLKFNYFTSTLQIVGFTMFEVNEKDAFLGFDSLLIDIKPIRLIKKEIHIQQCQIVNSFAQINQKDTVYNFSDLIDFYVDDNAIETVNESSGKARYRLNLNLLELKNGGIEYHDELRDHTLALHEVSFVIPNIYWGVQEKSKADVRFKVGRDGSFSSTFDYDTETGDFDGIFEAVRLDLDMILPYVKEFMAFSDIEGHVNTKIAFSGNEYQLEELEFKGVATLDSISVSDNKGKIVLGVVNAKTNVESFYPLKYRAVIDSLVLKKPYAYVALIDSSINFQQMMVEHARGTQAPGVESESKYNEQITLNRFIIEDGLVDFSDQRLYENFDYELSQLSVNMDTISLQDDWINVNAKMKLNKRGDLEASIGMNPMNPTQRMNIEYVITDFQLPDVNIYSKHYTGLPILFGDMYYVGNTTIVDNQLESKNELIIRNVEMGRKTGGLYNIPIKLALFILKDINGDIILDIPVNGDLSDPKTDIRAIVWDTFKGFMYKIVASPFKALGNLLSADPKELEEITLNYSDTLLLRKQERSLGLLLELEEMKPELNIELQYLNDRKLERTDVAATLMQEAFYKRYNKKAGPNPKAYKEFLANESGRDSMLIQDYELMLVQPRVVDSIVTQREDIRLQLVRDYIKAQNDSSKLRVLDYNAEEALNIGSRPRFNIKYSLAEDSEPQSFPPD